MKAVMSEVPPQFLEWRRKTGADRFDEVWEGVLHLVPTPHSEHQRLQARLIGWLEKHWVRSGSREVLPGFNVSRPGIPNWTTDYRVPDLLLITERATGQDRGTHFEGGPDAVVELRSPGDETYDKLPFYAAIGCCEVWVIDRDSRASEIYTCEDGQPVRRMATADGWLRSALGIELRTEDRRLAIRLEGDDATRALLP